MLHDTDSAEIRLISTGRCLYHVGAIAVLAVLSAGACTAETLSVWGGRRPAFAIGPELIGGCLAAALFGTTLLAALASGWEAARTWWRWHQLRPPAAVIDTSGVRYRRCGQEILLPWSDIEGLIVREPSLLIRLSGEAVRRLGGAALGAAGPRIRVPEDRTLPVGDLGQAGAPRDAILASLRRFAPCHIHDTVAGR